MSKNLCPVNDLTFENSQQIKFDISGGTVTEMPNPEACELNYWMNEWIKTL